MELEELCAVLEAELRESPKFFSDMLKEIENLDAKSSSMLEGINLKEKAINSRIGSRNPRKVKLYETQLDLLYVASEVKFVSKGDNSSVRSCTTLVNEKEHEQKKKVTSQEIELSESCYDISLKYAEVETDNEQLPRKLKNNEKKWF
ncbi:hypothetical protein FEM48_Zijuj03G0050100 [Ziziphus jujuba var. spinosa]|uniref:Uncharacterized protein n=1 Tax=Ziziphus jujuba var. spinosa TaxID=714518 RepID=A0A978VNB5_ZIZJJ|nr:hypothetical protein FEM48_Zijuj03G0050100 [Ziziphus jujuba var. spinosa]